MGEIKNMGILTNTPNIYDAVDYRVPDNTSLIYDDKYQGGEAVSCSKPDTIIFDTGIIEAGTFAGTYSLGFYYDSTTATVQGTPLMRWGLYEDGELIAEDVSDLRAFLVYEYDLNYVNYAYKYGMHLTKKLDADKTYQIIIKTADTLTNDAILDYITFSRHPENGIIEGRPRLMEIGRRNGGDTGDLSAAGAQLTVEVAKLYWTSLSLASDATDSAGVGYVTNFKSIDAVYTTFENGGARILCEWDGVSHLSSYYVTILIRNVSSSSVSLSNVYMKTTIIGYI